MNHVSDLIEKLQRLEDLVAITYAVRPHASTDHREAASGSMRNQKWLKYSKASLDKAKAIYDQVIRANACPGYLPRRENEKGR